jgi:tRNA nucleotidyltransferase (CCA-adding enzyme)
MPTPPDEAYWEHYEHGADIGVRGIAPTLAGSFEQAAIAMMAVVCDLDDIAAAQQVAVDCVAPDPELLLMDWLNALVYAMATRKLLFSRFEVSIDDDHLHATAWGEKVDVARHQPAVEIKGATFTTLEVKQRTDGLWQAQCVVDV